MSEHNPSSGSAPFEPLGLLWRFFAEPQTLLVLLGLTVGSLSLALLIPQIPLRAVDDPQGWLALQTFVPRQVGDALLALGLFDVRHSFWFRLLLILTGLTLFVWFVESAALAWQATVSRSVSPRTFSAWGNSPPRLHFPSTEPPHETQVRLADALKEWGYQEIDSNDLATSELVTGRRVWFLWTEPAVYAGLLVLLIGLGILGTWGWQRQDWQPGPGESTALDPAGSRMVRLDAFDLQRDPAGRVRQFSSEIAWLEDGSVTGQAIVGVGQPASAGGIAVRQVGYVPVVKIRGHDESGRRLAFQLGVEGKTTAGEIEVTFPTEDAQPLVFVPGQEQLLALTYRSLAQDGRPAVNFVLLGDGSPEDDPMAVLHDSGNVELDGLQLEADLEFRPVLRLDQRPGMSLVLGGLSLAVIALLVGWLASPRLLWVAVGIGHERATQVQLLALPRSRGSRWLGRLAARLQEVPPNDG